MTTKIMSLLEMSNILQENIIQEITQNKKMSLYVNATMQGSHIIIKEDDGAHTLIGTVNDEKLSSFFSTCSTPTPHLSAHEMREYINDCLNVSTYIERSVLLFDAYLKHLATRGRPYVPDAIPYWIIKQNKRKNIHSFSIYFKRDRNATLPSQQSVSRDEFWSLFTKFDDFFLPPDAYDELNRMYGSNLTQYVDGELNIGLRTRKLQLLIEE